jgi:hypothetical protein
MYSSLVSVGVVAATILSHALGHPGERIDLEDALLAARIRHVFADADYSELSKCGQDVESRHRAERAAKRRMQTFQRLRQEKGIQNDHPYMHRRDNAAFAKWSATSHDKTSTLRYTTDTPHADIFRANSTCILTPDNIIGPLYVQGEQIRTNIVEGHAGVPLHLEISFVNTQDCKSTPNLLIDIWQCNATGIYSGVSAAGQAGLKTTFLRGV